MPWISGAYLAKLTSNPEIKVTKTGKHMCSFRIVNNEGWGDNKKTEFIRCIAFGNTGNVINNNFKKGDWIIVSGQLRNNPYQKNERGYDIDNWQFNVQSVHFLPRVMNNDEEEGYSDYDAPTKSDGSIDAEYGEFQQVENVEDMPF